MGVAYIQKGAVVSYENRVATLKREVSEDTWQLEDNRTGYLEIKTVEDMLLALESGDLSFILERDQLIKTPPAKASLIERRFASYKGDVPVCTTGTLECPQSDAANPTLDYCA